MIIIIIYKFELFYFEKKEGKNIKQLTIKNSKCVTKKSQETYGEKEAFFFGQLGEKEGLLLKF